MNAARTPAISPWRLFGKRPRLPKLVAGLAPQAIFSPCRAPGKRIWSTVTAGIGFTITVRPPNSAPEPGRICSVVTPAASARENAGSPGRTACSIQVSATSGSLSSRTSETLASAALCGSRYTP